MLNLGKHIIGYLSDKIGRKFGMVRPSSCDISFLPRIHSREQMTAAGIVTLFSGLSAASSGAHGSVGGLLSMLSAMRYVIDVPIYYAPAHIHGRFLLGIGVGAEYPCGSVSASEQSEEPGINKNAQHRWFALATSKEAIFLNTMSYKYLTPYLQTL